MPRPTKACGRMPKDRKLENGLTFFENAWVMSYLTNGFRQDDAYLKAKALIEGNNPVPIDHHSLKVKASIMRNKPHVRAYIDEFIERSLAQQRARAVDVIQELGIIAGADIRDFIKWDGMTTTVKSSDELGEYARAIKKVTVEAGKVTLEMHDKVQSLNLLGKNKRLFVDNVDVTSKGKQIEGPRIYLPERTLRG